MDSSCACRFGMVRHGTTRRALSWCYKACSLLPLLQPSREAQDWACPCRERGQGVRHNARLHDFMTGTDSRTARGRFVETKPVADTVDMRGQSHVGSSARTRIASRSTVRTMQPQCSQTPLNAIKPLQQFVLRTEVLHLALQTSSETSSETPLAGSLYSQYISFTNQCQP